MFVSISANTRKYVFRARGRNSMTVGDKDMTKIAAAWCIAAMAGLIALSGSGVSEARAQEFISGGMGAAATHDAKAAAAFADIVRNKTDGRIDITHYPGGQLGNGQEQMEAVSTGTQHFFISAGSQASRLVKAFGIIDSAFLFKDFDHLIRFMNSDMGQELNDQLAAEFGVRVVSANWFGLPRYLMHRDKFIETLSDVEGVRTRTASVPMFVKNYENMGAVPVKIAYGEQYLALSQGVVDMTESAANRILGTKLYEVAPFITEADMMFPQNSVFVNEAFWDSLIPEDQTIVKEAADEAGLLYSTWSREAFEAEKQEIIANGGKFKPMPEDVRNQFAKKTEENVDEMVAEGLFPEGWYEKIVKLREAE